MKVGDIHQLEPNIHAMVMYLRFMMDQFYEEKPMDWFNRRLFTFASPNAGPGRVQQLRREASRRGVNPNIWFNDVETVAAEKVGRDTVQCMSNIYKYVLPGLRSGEGRERRTRQNQERARTASWPLTTTDVRD